MRTVITAVFALHGAIHVLGFLKWTGLVPLPQLGGRTLWPLSGGSARLFALLWLSACLLLLATAVLRISRSEAWWMPGLAGVLLSQALIVVAWSDAKVGTLVNLVLLAQVVVAAAQTRLDRSIDAEVAALLSRVQAQPGPVVTEAELQPLPAPVRAWLKRAGVVGRPRARSVRLKQRGQMRTAPGAAWMPVEAEQYFRVDDPAFVWRVRATMLGILPLAGRDAYGDGKGRMTIKAASLVNVVDADDEKVAHGAALRFLAEMIWFPSAALCPWVQWEPIDDRNAKATMRHAGLEASAVFRFDAEGRVASMHAQRFMGGGKDARLLPWSGVSSAFRTFGGVEIPAQGEVRWSLPEGELTYYRYELVELEQDRPEAYPAAARRAPPRAEGQAVALEAGGPR